jgi:tetratricopeptide (TPR) repeat protein
VVAGLVSRLFEEDSIPDMLSAADDTIRSDEAGPLEAAVPEAVSLDGELICSEPATIVEEIVAQIPGTDEMDPLLTQDTTIVENQASAESNVDIASAVSAEPAHVENPAPARDLSNMREIDLKNAHIWNELGNIFVKASSLDDAIDAYNKAIELEPEFGWPYSNLGLVYAQKGHFGETISLYQKSVELFSSNKDKAVSWNRLGDAYRQLNEYDNAIAAYQIADELNQNEDVAQSNMREVNLSQASPIFSYLYGGSNDRF